MATLNQLQGRKFDPERYAAAVRKAHHDVAKRRGQPPPADEDTLPVLPPVEDETLKPRHRD